MNKFQITTLIIVFLAAGTLMIKPFSDGQTDTATPSPASSSIEEMQPAAELMSMPKVEKARVVMGDMKTAVEDSEDEFAYLFDPANGSPYCLFRRESYGGRLPTEENYMLFCKQQNLVPSLSAYMAFTEILELDVLQLFILSASSRAYIRHENDESPVDLLEELSPVYEYVYRRNFPEELELWEAMDQYAIEVSNDKYENSVRYIGNSPNEKAITDIVMAMKRRLISEARK